MAEITRRARQLRLRRRAGRAGVTILALGLIGVVAVPLWPGQEESLTAPAAVEALNPCLGEESRTTYSSLTEHPELAYLPPPSIAPLLKQVPPTTSHTTDPRCPVPAAAGDWYSLAADGTVAKKLTVRGPGYSKYRANTPNMNPRELRQDGRSGVFYQVEDSSWQAGYGSRQVTINGAVGWINGNNLLWQLAPGVIGDVSGEITSERALSLARATKKVSMTDPRLERQKYVKTSRPP
jgi:hypothetical protein